MSSGDVCFCYFCGLRGKVGDEFGKTTNSLLANM